MNTSAPFIDTAETITFTPRSGSCEHLDQAQPVRPSAQGCEECLKTGDGWVHLRVCMTCGHVGCCDQSPGRHAFAHFEETGHPIIRSHEPDEVWGWCWVDQVQF